MSPPPTDLTDDEIARACAPLKQPAAQVRHLRRMGLRVDRTADGRPLVNRAHYDAVRGRPEGARATPAAEPRWSRP